MFLYVLHFAFMAEQVLVYPADGAVLVAIGAPDDAYPAPAALANATDRVNVRIIMTAQFLQPWLWFKWLALFFVFFSGPRCFL